MAMAIELTRIGQFHVGLVGLAALIAFATRWLDAGSVIAGGVVMGVNFWLLRLIAGALLSGGEHRRVALGIAAMILKFGLFIGLLAVLFWRLPIEGMSFVCGVTMLLLACLLELARSELGAGKGGR